MHKNYDDWESECYDVLCDAMTNSQFGNGASLRIRLRVEMLWNKRRHIFGPVREELEERSM